MSRKRLVYLFFALLCAWLWAPWRKQADSVENSISKGAIAQALETSLQNGVFPELLEFPTRGSYVPRYSLNRTLQAYMQRTLEQYAPDYGAVVVIDAATGAILSLANYSKESEDAGNVALHATYPAASIFKVVTATAAIDQGKAVPETVIEFNGSNHTLYRRNVTSTQQNRWTRRMTMREAFAKSVNTVFGKIGAFILKPGDLESYARRFQFNQSIQTDVPLQAGTFILNPEDPFAVAEAASGYSRLALMSPVQGAMIAAAVVNDGIMMEPYLVEKLSDKYGESVYQAHPHQAAFVMSDKAARQVKSMMAETVHLGTARKSYRDFRKRNRDLVLEIGGKTGSLTGSSPKGKYDWYVGFASDGEKKLAIAALTINVDVWRVKSAYLARLATETFFKDLDSLVVLPYRTQTD